jgi:hypothetical protein
MPVSHVGQQLEGAGEDLSTPAAQAPVVLPYEAPCLIRVGNVRDLVAGAAGTANETQDPFAKKQSGQPG